MSQGNKRSSHSMKRGKNLEPIPTDLVIEILSRLNAKSIARFRCVSKLWGSIFHRPYFTELFLTRSQALPRLLFAVEGQSGEWSFYSSPQLHNPYQKSSFVVAADFQMNFPRVKTMWIPSVEQLSYRYVSGGMSSRNRLELWVLEDAEKQDWSKHVYTLPSNKIVGALSVVGITARGDFVLAMEYAFKQFWVCYFNPERNTLLIVEIQGFGTHAGAFKFGKVHVFLDHIEDLNFNNASQASLLHL